jgi:hypothetical protein
MDWVFLFGLTIHMRAGKILEHLGCDCQTVFILPMYAYIH